MTWPQYQRCCCTVDGEHIYLTPHQTELLAVLLIRRGRLVTREELWEAVWPDPDFAPEIKIVDVQICKVRQAVGGIIQTEWGRGYWIPRPADADRLGVAA
jgi:DNA-binding response OmpR family regulator